MKKVALSLLLAAVMITVLFCAVTTTSAASSGTCGTNLTWTLDDNGTLTISGSGDMNNYVNDSYGSAWENYKNIIKKVIIEDQVTSIGEDAFRYCYNLNSVSIGKSLTKIGKNAFFGCTSLKSITIPDSVTTIGDYVFCYCDSLESITIPDSVTTIGNHVFDNCTSLKSITISDSVTTIGDSVFYNCYSLESITIPDSVTTIGDHVFDNCDSLTSITFPDSVTSIGRDVIDGCDNLKSITIGDGDTVIGEFAFWYCDSLESVTIGDGDTVIGKHAFWDCDNLKSVTIGNGGVVIEEGAFYKCENLTTVTIGNGIKSIGDMAFDGCTSLKSIILPDSLTTIGSQAFRECTSLESVVIGKNVTSIGSNAFGTCNKLTNIIIPAAVTTIGSNAFFNCSSLESIVVEAGNKNYVSVNGVLYDKNKTVLICYPTFKKDKTYVVPGSVTRIESRSFYGNKNIANITIPDSVTSIGDYTFMHCTNLENMPISANVTDIGDCAFSDCQSLKSIEVAKGNTVYCSDDGVLYSKDKTTIICHPGGKIVETYTFPDFVTQMDWGAFYGCTFKNVIIPDKITSISHYAFANCDNLTSVTIPDSVTYIGNYAFEECNGLKNMVIPDSVIDMWGNVFNGCTALESVTIGENIKNLGTYIFRDCVNLTQVNWNIKRYSGLDDYYQIFRNAGVEGEGIKIVFGDNVETIPAYLFFASDDPKVKSITIGKNVKYIGQQAFDGCYDLEEIIWNAKNAELGGQYAFLYAGKDSQGVKVTFGDSVEKIPAYCFGQFSSYTPKITSVTIGKSVTSIGICAFSNCDGLTSVTIPDSVTSIGAAAFSSCDGLTSVTIGKSVTSIGDSAFSNCDGLTSITIPDSVASIGDSAFYNCTNLTQINWNAKSVADFSSNNRVFYNAGKNGTGIKVVFGDSVEKIPAYCFCYDTSYAPKITSVTIGKSVTSIGRDAFSDCDGLTSVTIPDSVTSIGNYAFSDCDSLTSITIPDSVTSIGRSAFSDCSKLTSVTIGENVTSIGNYAFYNCRNLTQINWNAKSVADFSSNNDVFGYAGQNGTGIKVVFGDSVEKIPAYCFFPYSNSTLYTPKITSVTIGKNVKNIGDYAFYNCNDIKTAKYRGTEAEWEAVEVGAWNSTLVNAIENCASVVKNIKSTETGFELEVAIKKEKTEDFETAKMIVAVYDDENRFIGVETITIDSDDTTKTVQIETDNSSDYAKIMLWDTLDTIDPLGQDSEISLN